ncbi:MAG: SNF2-related protein, partial [Peptoniphilus grossensis]
MIYKPHDYQNYAREYIESHKISAVFLDCGLGKTSITLTALNNLLFDYFEAHKILVIAPLRVARNTWSAEIKKWDHLKNLEFSVAVGSEKERLKALEKRADIYVINRENVHWLIEKSGIKFD